MALDVTDPVARVEFIPAAVEVLRDQPELDDEHTGQVESSHLTPLFTPQAQKSLLSSLPMMIRASEPPIKFMRSGLCGCFLREVDVDCGFLHFCANG
jgi:hypothetical protein